MAIETRTRPRLRTSQAAPQSTPQRQSVLLARVRNPSLQLGLSALVATVAVGASVAMKELSDSDSTIILLIAVMVVAWYADLRSSMLTLVVVSAAALFLIYDPKFEADFDTTADTVRMGVFLVVAPTVAFVFQRIRGVELERDSAMQNVATLNADLTHANQDKDAFVGLVAHELRSPLTVIRGTANVLVRHSDRLDAASQAAALRGIEHESERLAEVVEQLLTLARLDRGMSLPVEPTLIARHVERAVTEHRAQNPHREIEVRGDLDVTPVVASPVYLDQVLRNLLSNAEKYSPVEAPIIVAIKRRAMELVTRVCDGGSGVPEDDVAEVFTPFFRSPRNAGRAEGVGVGLAVCKRLIEAQNGRIWARNRAEGGFEVGFALPVDQQEGLPTWGRQPVRVS